MQSSTSHAADAQKALGPAHGSTSNLKLVERPIAEAQGAPPGVVPLKSWLQGEDSGRSTRVSIMSASNERCLGTALVTLAEESSAISRLKLPRAALERCITVSDVALDPDAGDVLPALLYACLRRGRIWNRPTVTTQLTKDTLGGAKRFDLVPLTKLRSVEQGGETWVAVAQRIDLSIHRAWAATSTELKPFLREQLVPEAVETLERWIPHFFKLPYFQSIYNGTMTKEQYIYGLSNMHQFVRWTTRLCGLAVASSHERPMRDKWLDHLQGEINHEVIIEDDLRTLDADVDYLVNDMVPSVSVQAFMVAQESAIAFHKDPISFMAAPFVAEGFTARLDRHFIDSLRRVAKSWGVENPKKCTAFWASHIEYDGGDDGHWEKSRSLLEKYLHTDHDLLRFLNVLRLACDAFERSYTSYIEDLAIFEASSG